MAKCPECGNAVSSALHEFVDDEGRTEEELYACPACGNAWSEFP